MYNSERGSLSLNHLKSQTFSFVLYTLTASVPHLFYGLKRADGLLYVALKEKYEFPKAKEMCQRLPGHRLAITKFKKQYNSLMMHAQRLDSTFIIIKASYTSTKCTIYPWNVNDDHHNIKKMSDVKRMCEII